MGGRCVRYEWVGGWVAGGMGGRRDGWIGGRKDGYKGGV
jgi:hypothetical protein